MENLIFILASAYLFRQSAQKIQFRKYNLGTSGASMFFPNHELTLDKKTQPNGNVVYFGKSQVADVTYGVVAIQLYGSKTLENKAGALLAFMESLHPGLGIRHSAGETVELVDADTEIATVTDYWQDENGCDWKVKGWSNGQMMSVLYIKNIGEVASHKQEFFLRGFEFPATTFA